MSLLDDVSIVVTPNGYKAGELYAVVPVPTEGAEEVVNSDFSSDTWWGLDSSWTISGGSANSNGTGTMYKGGILTIGKRYIVKVDVSAYTSGSLSYPNASYNIPSSIGTYTFDYVASSQTISFTGTSFVGSIDNVSVKEYTSADMDVTRATAGTRVDEDGLVNYAEIVSDTELITNGDFASSTGWSFTNSGGSNGWIIDSGRAICDSSATTPNRNLDSTFSLVNGKSYRLIIDILQSEDNMSIIIGSTQLSETLPTGTHLNYEYFIPESAHSGGTFAIYAGSSDLQEIDNVSVKEVTRDNVPRIDYTGGGCPHILSEPMRTNLVTYSEDFSQWNNARTTDTSNQATSPDGTNNATYLEQNTGETNAGSIYAPVTVIATDYSFSIFAKKKEKDFIVAYDSNANRTYFNISNGTLGNNGSGGTSKIEDYGNGWYRCSVSYTESSAASTNIAWYLGDTNGSTTVTDSGGVYIYGCQLEEGSYATSYIPTSGSTVTRNQDIFTRDGIGSLINSTEGVLFVEMAALANDGVFRIISLSDGGTTNRVSLIYNTSSNSIRVMVVSTSTVFDTSNSVTSTLDFHKIAIKWKLNDFAVWIDGVEVATDTSGATPIGLDRIVFDVGDGSLFPFFGKVKQLQVYDTALTDTQLAALTS